MCVILCGWLFVQSDEQTTILCNCTTFLIFHGLFHKQWNFFLKRDMQSKSNQSENNINCDIATSITQKLQINLQEEETFSKYLEMSIDLHTDCNHKHWFSDTRISPSPPHNLQFQAAGHKGILCQKTQK